MNFHYLRLNVFPEGSPEALGWRHLDDQQKRFEILSGVDDMSYSTILDLGCGYGDLKTFLDKKFNDFIYVGIDIIPEYIDTANAKFKDANNTYFFQKDITAFEIPVTDYILACGLMAYKTDDPEFYFQMIKRMYDSASKAVAFNMLDSNTFQSDDLLIAHNPESIIEYCKKITPQIKLITNYGVDDFTIFMYK
ncbi:MAG TPA: class I SAM-dependent methyltransferase [Bacteroidales bacterium]|nr:class I SAM-dependent methyltransferase [Bacteroidales bacterium]HPS16055.1 class I SAM-dependent methyltransferase [Bacteroidales bacterium]